MPTIAIRPLAPRDVPALRNVRHECASLDLSGESVPRSQVLRGQVLSSLPFDVSRDRCYLARVDGEPYALVTLRQQRHRYRWDVISLSVGSSMIEPDPETCRAAWIALLEYAIKEAGSTGAKRLFALSTEDSLAYDCLQAAGFEPYSRVYVLTGHMPSSPVPLPPGVRLQESSDVWSIHQLYHHVTPSGVQYAEALTSSAWEIDNVPLWKRIAAPQRRDISVVLEIDHAIDAYCRVEWAGESPILLPLIDRECDTSLYQFVLAAASIAGVARQSLLRIVVPAYASELIAPFVQADFAVESMRVAMVRHTTSRVVARVRMSPLPVEAGERVPRGIPTYCRARFERGA